MAPDTPGREARPWHREPWPWIIIGMLGAVVIASFATLWIAIANPDLLVVEDAEYQRIKSELRANPPARATNNEEDAQAQADHDDG